MRQIATSGPKQNPVDQDRTNKSKRSCAEPSLAKLQARLQLSEIQLQKLIVRSPMILACRFESNLGPKLDFLQEELDISLKTLREYE